MGNLTLSGATSGQITLAPTAVAGTNTITLPAGTGTAAVNNVSTNIVQGTSQNTTSGTAILFTGIPSWAKRVSIIFNAVSTSGTSIPLIQVGSGSVTTSGYTGNSQSLTTSPGSAVSTASSGWPIQSSTATNTFYGAIILYSFGSNTWIASGLLNQSTIASSFVNGAVTLGGALDRVNITTNNGTDTFDAGAINIFYE